MTVVDAAREALIYGALAVVLIGGSYALAQLILARIYHEPLQTEHDGPPAS